MNDSAPAAWELDTSIPSDPSQACELIRNTIAYLEDQQWNAADVFAVHMALEEAIMNSIKHGNKRDLSKRVFVQIRVFPDSFHSVITDEGEGFDCECLPDPRCAENLEKDCGRGVMLIREFMDTVDYANGGRQVTLFKKRTG